MCLSYLKFSDLLPETHLFLYPRKLCGRAVMVIGDIDVSIKESCDIHIDTEIWISILIQELLFSTWRHIYHGGSKQSFHTPRLYAQDSLSCFSDSYIKVLPNRNLKQKFHAPVEHYPYHRAATQLTCNHILTGTIGLYQYSGTIPKMHKCMITSESQRTSRIVFQSPKNQ